MLLSNATGDLTVTNTAGFWVLVPETAGTSRRVNNTAVVHVDLSMDTPSAVVDFQFGRAEITSAVSAAAVSQPFSEFLLMGLADMSALSGTASYSGGLTAALGKYYHSGGETLQLSFPEPIRSLVGNGSANDQAFGFRLKRIDDSAGISCRLNVWYSEL